MSNTDLPHTEISAFKKSKDFLICVDSDGCAMDSMNIKHLKCFGPLMIKEWELYRWENDILEIWNEINLYTKTRGVNRFRGLALTLKAVNERFHPIAEIGHLLFWSERGRGLSNDSLRREIADNPDIGILKKALSWSTEVNRAIESLGEDEILPFEGVKAGLRQASEFADIAVVSGANADALIHEWCKHGLAKHANLLLSQSAGSKSFCIGELVKKGYSPHKVLMCGDAVGDLEAADANGVFFFPVLVRRENESWNEFPEALKRLSGGDYSQYGEKKKAEFLNNLS